MMAVRQFNRTGSLANSRKAICGKPFGLSVKSSPGLMQFRKFSTPWRSSGRCGCAACNPSGAATAIQGVWHTSGRFYAGCKPAFVSDRNGRGGEDNNGMRFNPAEATMSLGMNTALSGGTKKPSTGSLSIQGAIANTGPTSSPYGSIPDLFHQNRQWSERINTEKPEFFETLSKQQAPKFLWIGCSDSRVPANEVVDLRPGELFVHRNVANVVVHTDLNCLSVIQYAVDYLRVEHIIICGHYGCGGVKAALNGNRLGLIDNWLRHIVDVRDKHKWAIEACPYPEQLDLLCELNVIEQAVNICETTVVQDAWSRGQNLQVHSWIYGLDNGLLKDLGLHVTMQRELEPRYDGVLKRYSTRT